MIDHRDLRRLVLIALAIVAIWTVFGIFNSSEFYRRTVETGWQQPWPELIAYQLSASLIWAVFTPFIFFVAERLPLRPPHVFRNSIALLAFIPSVAVVRAVFGGIVSEVVGDRRAPALAFLQYSVTHRFHRNVFLVVVIIGVTYFILAQRGAAERERNALALRTAMMNAELQRLRASMQPRMMFATLDAIVEKIATSPDVADRMLIHLGDLLRTMLDFGKRPFVTLGEELEVIDRYFEIEKTRTEGAFTTRVDVEEEVLGAHVPPLLLHALIESALLPNGTESPQRLEILGRKQEDILILEILNDDSERAPSAEAIEETRARLRQAFSNDASVTWRREENRIVTELVMPFLAEAAA